MKIKQRKGGKKVEHEVERSAAYATNEAISILLTLGANATVVIEMDVDEAERMARDLFLRVANVRAREAKENAN